MSRYCKSLRAFGKNLTGSALRLLEKKLAAAALKPAEPAPSAVVSRPLGAPMQQAWPATAGKSLLEELGLMTSMLMSGKQPAKVLYA